MSNTPTPSPQPIPDSNGKAEGPSHGNPTPLTSTEFTGLKVGERKSAAAGVMAVVESMAHIQRESGLVRGNKVLLQLNQKGGFDCPGCAWPDPEDKRSTFEYCENGAKAVAEETTLKRVDPAFMAAHSVAELSQWSDMEIGKSGRLTHPMVLRPGATHYEPLSWDEAFALVGNELKSLESPDEAIFYTSGRTSNEAAFLYQLYVRLFGTNNLPDCSNMCHESSGCAMTETIGVGKGTVSLADFDLADSIWIIGQNPGTNHPRMLTALQKARKNGARIVAINPIPETGLLKFQHPQHPLDMLTGGTPLAELFLPVRINGDVALFKGILKAMLEAEDAAPGTCFDHEFVAQHTHGYNELVADLRLENWNRLVQISGISREQMSEAAQLALGSKRMICCWAMGLTQHENAVANIQEVINLLLLGGHIGRPGAGACPVRGHSNVQGDRTMGIWERPLPQLIDALRREFGFEPPQKIGFDVVESIKAMHNGKARVFVAMGGNFVSATPDTALTAQALQKCSLTVQISTKLHRGHLITGKTALILPCLGRTETDIQAGGPQFVTVENSMSVVHSSQGRLEPASPELRSEPAIVAGLAKATLAPHPGLDWDALVANYDRIRDHIEHVIPGFTHFNQRVREPNDFLLPNTARDRIWKTETGKANFTVHQPRAAELAPGQLLMMTIRSHDQYNTTIYGLDDRYRGVYNERRVVFLNEEDMREQSIAPQSVVDLISHFAGEERVAPRFIALPYSIPKGCAATYFPEANVLVPIGSVAKTSNTPTSKSVVISLRPVQETVTA